MQKLYICARIKTQEAMTKKDAIKIFEDKKIRAVWDDKKEEWFFSIVDVVAVLTDSDNPRRYWSDLKRKLSKKGVSCTISSDN